MSIFNVTFSATTISVYVCVYNTDLLSDRSSRCVGVSLFPLSNPSLIRQSSSLINGSAHSGDKDDTRTQLRASGDCSSFPQRIENWEPNVNGWRTETTDLIQCLVEEDSRPQDRNRMGH